MKEMTVGKHEFEVRESGNRINIDGLALFI